VSPNRTSIRCQTAGISKWVPVVQLCDNIWAGRARGTSTGTDAGNQLRSSWLYRPSSMSVWWRYGISCCWSKHRSWEKSGRSASMRLRRRTKGWCLGIANCVYWEWAHTGKSSRGYWIKGWLGGWIRRRVKGCSEKWKRPRYGPEKFTMINKRKKPRARVDIKRIHWSSQCVNCNLLLSWLQVWSAKIVALLKSIRWVASWQKPLRLLRIDTIQYYGIFDQKIHWRE